MAKELSTAKEKLQERNSKLEDVNREGSELTEEIEIMESVLKPKRPLETGTDDLANKKKHEGGRDILAQAIETAGISTQVEVVSQSKFIGVIIFR